MKNTFLKDWFKDAFDIMAHELKQIGKDGGVLLIFLAAGLIYPLLYNVVYLNGTVSDVPVAVVDNADCQDSHRFIREIDATPELSVAAKCVNMEEARRLMEERKVNGIIMFPRDFGAKLARMETSTFSIYADMSSFLFYKSVLMGTNFVMLHEIGQIQMERYAMAGLTGQEISQLVKPIGYDDNNPFNRAFDYSFFLISAILMIIIQQVMFYGMSMLAGTQRERNHSFASLPDKLSGHGVVRVLLGRGGAYWLIFMGIGLYVSFIVPSLFGIPQRGRFVDIFNMLLFYVTDCVFFSMAWSSLITRRESVFLLFLSMSPVAVFLSGCSWPTVAFPGFWKLFSYIFPSTFGVQAFMNMSTAGGDMGTAHSQMIVMIVQTITYFLISYIAIFVENWIIRHKEEIRERRERLAAKVGIDREKDARIISGQ